ncbi:MHYT domain-containing protein [Pseudomonas massiliensis]|uniref:MHYT domain-containing protein n=1 Tax=Pseudomonas massiliensis TaxID=522492 RepID=UPI00058EA09C|nr:MHYT domain-containing protein [Pseudomonas massiliensis]
MQTTYSISLVCLSVLIAIAGSFTALDLAGRAQASRGSMSRVWLCAAAFCMGGSVWSMHFVGMLAFGMPGMEIQYDLGLTLASLLVPIAVTAVSFFAVAPGKPDRRTLATGGVFMGLGIGAMHYMGMAAMTLHAHLSYSWGWVVLSFMIAISASTVALWLSAQARRLSFQAISALAMGVAVAGMHYTAMAGANFTPMEDAVSLSPGSELDLLTLAISVAGSTFIILFLGLAASLHDRRMAMMGEREAQALRTSEARLRHLYSKTPLPLHALDSEGRLESVSDAWLRLVGYRREDVIGRPLTSFMTESSARQLLSQDWPVLLQTGECLNSEYRLVVRDGKFIDVLASVRWEETSQGPLIIGGLVNITERKNAEAALRQAQKMEAVGKLTGGVAHDFNNLLNVISGSLELLRARLPSDIPRAEKLIDNALMATQRGAALTQRMLAFARKQELKPVSAGLAETVLGLRDLLQRSAGPSIAIECRFALSLPPAYVDVNQLEMVLMNLVVNARDAMHAGGTIFIEGQLRLACPSPQEAEREYVVLSVRDTGTGMSPETLRRATEPFFTTKGPGKGTGLGLSMAHGLAEQSGGRFEIHSELGKGTCIELWLPVGQAAPSIEPVASAVEPPANVGGRALSVLLVDDDPLVLANTCDLLEDLGHKVTVTSTPEAALVALRASTGFDLMITDQMMPGMTGTQLIQVAAMEWPWMPALLATGYAELSEVERPRHVLAKPFSQQALCGAIQAVMGPEKSKVVPLR